MNKIIFFCFILLSYANIFCAPSFLSISSLAPGKVMIQAGMDVFQSTNDMSTLFDGGFRIGLPIPKGSDIGLKFYNLGSILDLKVPFYSFPPLRTAVDIECDIYQLTYIQTSVSPAFILDIEFTSYFNAYFTLRWRYPAAQAIDSMNIFFGTQSYVFVSGVAFYTRVGVELFRNSHFSILLECGPVTSWSSKDLGINGGGALEYKF